MHRLDAAFAVGVQAGFHLHRLDGQQQVARLHRPAGLRHHGRHHPGHRRADLVRVAGIGLGPHRGLGLHPSVRHPDAARLAVQLEEHLGLAGLVGLGDGLHQDFQRLAGVDLGRDLLARLHAVEEGPGRQGPDRTVEPVALGVFGEDLGIHQVAVEVLVVDRPVLEPRRERRALGREVHRRHLGTGAAGERRLALEDLALQRHGPAARGLADLAAHQVDHRFGEGDLDGRILDLLAGQPLRDHHQRHVADHLGRRRDLDDVAEHPVHLGIGVGHLVPAVLEPEAAGLGLEVGELPAGHLVQVDLRGGGPGAGLEGRILVADPFPVVRDVADRVDVEAGVAFGVPQRLDDRADRRLRGAAGHRVHGGVDRVHPGLGRSEDRGPGDAAGVVGVEVDRQPDLLLQRPDEHAGGGGLEQPGHVLQPEDMRAGVAQRLAGLDIVAQVVFRPVGVEDVAGVADRRLEDLAALAHRVHGDMHVLDPVEAVEHPEHVHPRARRLGDEALDHVVGVVGVADPVRRPQQHLRQDVRHRLADVAQPLPRAFLQEAIGHVEGGPAPALDREQPRQVRGIGRRHPDHVDRAHPRRQQRLVGVAHGGVGDQQPLLRRHPVGHRLRPLLLQQLPGAARGLGPRRRRLRPAQGGRRLRQAGGLGMPVDADIGDVGQDAGGAVAPRLELEKLGGRVDEPGGGLVRQEHRVLQQVDDEVDIGRDAAHPELAQGPVHAADGAVGGLRPGRHLDEERIVEAGDDRAGIGGAAVQPDAVAGGGAVGGDAAVIGDEVVLRVLGRDPALDRVAGERHRRLRGRAGRLGQGRALGDADLRLHDVDAGDLLGHGMLDLHPRVDLDEVEGARVDVLQELDGAGIHIADRPADPEREAADLLALLGGEIGGGGALDDLLVAALHGAVALVEMVEPAMAVAEQLHLDVPGALDHLLEIALAAAEGGLGLAPALADLGLQLARGRDRAHAAPAAAPAGLEHQRVADRLGLARDLGHVVAEHAGRRDHRHAGLNGDLAGRGLVAERPHGRRGGADEGDAGGGAGIDEIRVLGEQAVARMDGVAARLARHPDHLGDRQIGRDRPQPGADTIGLVGLEPVQRELVLLGIDRDRALAELVGGAQDADGDLAAVGDQDLFEHWVPFPRLRGARAP